MTKTSISCMNFNKNTALVVALQKIWPKFIVYQIKNRFSFRVTNKTSHLYAVSASCAPAVIWLL